MDRFNTARTYSKSLILKVKHLSSPLLSVVHFLDNFVFPAPSLWNHVLFVCLKDDETVLK